MNVNIIDPVVRSASTHLAVLPANVGPITSLVLITKHVSTVGRLFIFSFLRKKSYKTTIEQNSRQKMLNTIYLHLKHF